MVPPDAEMGRWLLRAMQDAAYTVTVVGHPDPRQAPRRPDATGQAFASAQPGKDAPYQQQQIEKLFRGMCQAGHEFVFLVLASRLPQSHLARLLAGVAEEASAWKSRQSGTKSINLGFAVPLMFSGAVSRQAALGYTEQESASHSRGVGVSQAHTEGTSEADTVGGAQTWSTSHTVGRAHTEGVAHTSGVSVTEEQAHAERTSESWGESHSTGVARTHTETSSWMDGVAESHGVASGSNWGVSSSDSVGASWDAGVASQHAHAEGMQSGWNASQSAGGSHSLAESAAQSTTVNAGGSVGRAAPDPDAAEGRV